MALGVIASIHDLVELVVTAVSILGGFMAFYSGLEAHASITIGEEPEEVAFRINQGLAYGFNVGLPVTILVATLLALI